MSFASAGMAASLSPALEHLEVDHPASPDLTIHVWEGTAEGRVPLAEPYPPGTVADGEIWFARRGSVVTAVRPRSAILYRLDTSRNLALYWLPEGTLPFDEKVAPARHILAWWLRGGSSWVVHAGAVGAPAGGLLLAGANGTGKSTVALSCLHAGLLFGGDNYVVVRDGPIPTATTLYSSVSLRIPHARRYPALLSSLESQESRAGGKVFAFVHGRAPECFAKDMPLVGVALPVVSDGARSRFERIGSSAALKALLSNTITPLYGRDPAVLRFLSRLVRELPAFRLHIGRDVAAIPRAVSELLATVLDGRTEEPT
jgi:hypothetical protein